MIPLQTSDKRLEPPRVSPLFWRKKRGGRGDGLALLPITPTNLGRPVGYYLKKPFAREVSGCRAGSFYPVGKITCSYCIYFLNCKMGHQFNSRCSGVGRGRKGGGEDRTLIFNDSNTKKAQVRIEEMWLLGRVIEEWDRSVLAKWSLVKAQEDRIFLVGELFQTMLCFCTPKRWFPCLFSSRLMTWNIPVCWWLPILDFHPWGSS